MAKGKESKGGAELSDAKIGMIAVGVMLLFLLWPTLVALMPAMPIALHLSHMTISNAILAGGLTFMALQARKLFSSLAG